jgi:hypothetical protein
VLLGEQITGGLPGALLALAAAAVAAAGVTLLTRAQVRPAAGSAATAAGIRRSVARVGG